MERQLNIIYPSIYNQLTKVDELYQKEYDIAKSLGFGIILFDYDYFIETDNLKIHAEKKFENADTIYRGYMMRDSQYFSFYEKLQYKSLFLKTKPPQYNQLHYFPNIYDYIKDFTPKIESFVVPISDVDLMNIKSHFQGDMFIKDFVKSEKGNPKFERINKDISISDLQELIFDFVEARKPLFNKGIVLKEYVELKKPINEWRVFCSDGLMHIIQNSNLVNCNVPDTTYIQKILNILNKYSSFYTFDVAETENGWILLECGDGQVSGLPENTNIETFYMIF